VVIKAKHRITKENVAIKLIDNLSSCPYTAKKVLREVLLMRKFAEIPHNCFTVKLIDVILPKDIARQDSDQTKESSTN
jgi:hypothetical protein